MVVNHCLDHGIFPKSKKDKLGMIMKITIELSV